ncbi:AAA family ATPase [bacterium]|nr:AAA family ATPase [bacterium]
MLKVCLTGGPCGGKSSAQSMIAQTMRERGYTVLFCPETATELILNGIIPGDAISLHDFQKIVLEKQLAKEKLYDDIALNYFDDDKLIIVYDRGLCDQMAYIEKDDFLNMLDDKAMTLSDAYSHYDCVLHLETAAKGAEQFYEWNGAVGMVCKNAARSESPEEARIKDEKTLNAWIGHPHLRVFDNKSDFETKIRNVIAEICNMLGDPVPKEIERKYLIKKPSAEEIENLGYVSKTQIMQIYLTSDGKTERRVRQRGTKSAGYTFYYTEKTDIGNGERLETERKISPEEYIERLSDVDINLYPVSKTRYCFIHDKRYFEMDVYPISDEYAILEVELNDINEKINLPNLTVIRDVTDDYRYRNKHIAATLNLNYKPGTDIDSIRADVLERFKNNMMLTEDEFLYVICDFNPDIHGPSMLDHYLGEYKLYASKAFKSIPYDKLKNDEI